MNTNDANIQAAGIHAMQAAGIDNLIILVERWQIDTYETVVQPEWRGIATIQVEGKDSLAEKDDYVGWVSTIVDTTSTL